ncbi:MAG: chorismate-binding protein, partial [Cytophagales bacterium]
SEIGFINYKEINPKKLKLDYIVEEPSKQNNHYVSIVEKAKGLLNEDDFLKIVLARKKSINLSDDFDVWDTFLKVAKEMPNHFVSLHYTPKFGLWLGASPETLISVEGDIFRTVALAGSQAYKEGMLTQNATWTQKEIEEQALVSRYIIDCFKKIRLREYQDIGPKTVIAGNLMHLKTEFWVNMKEVNFPQLGTVMLRLLHPTSAVCGMPKEKAIEFISQNENFDRKLYSGYLGPVNLEGNSRIFVNLRCTEIINNIAVLYAGAGITTGSDPEKEFLETEMKMQAVGRFLQ